MLTVLEPLWQRVPETASRLRGRIEAILAFATMRSWREKSNPAVWRGHMQLLLPAKSKVRPVVHHAALDWQEAPAFMAALRSREGAGARPLEFAILTAARSGEVRGATWEEIDIERCVWTIPAARMKAMRPHRVPLAPQALSLLRRMREISGATSLVFPGAREGRMSDMTLTAVLRRMGRAELTAHGFRSTFRDWCAEAPITPTTLPRRPCSGQSHRISDSVIVAIGACP